MGQSQGGKPNFAATRKRQRFVLAQGLLVRIVPKAMLHLLLSSSLIAHADKENDHLNHERKVTQLVAAVRFNLRRRYFAKMKERSLWGVQADPF